MVVDKDRGMVGDEDGDKLGLEEVVDDWMWVWVWVGIGMVVGVGAGIEGIDIVVGDKGEGVVGGIYYYYYFYCYWYFYWVLIRG